MNNIQAGFTEDGLRSGYIHDYDDLTQEEIEALEAEEGDLRAEEMRIEEWLEEQEELSLAEEEE